MEEFVDSGEIGLIINYTDQNKNSFNALLGALEVNSDTKLDIYLAKSDKEIIRLIENKIHIYNKLIVAFSFFTPQVKKVLLIMNSLLKEKKKYGDKLILIAGGPHPSGDPRGTIEMGFDFVFIGEGEISFPKFLRAIINNQDVFSIKGIMYKVGDDYIFTGKENVVNLDDYPPFSIKYRKFGPIEITRGCPFCCYYCQTPQLFGAKVRHRSEESIIKWVTEMRKHKLRDIRYVSPNAFSYGSKDGRVINLESLESLFSRVYESIRPNGRQFIASFPSEVRPEHVCEETLDVVLKYGSNKSIIFGAQTGSNNLLDKINRKHNIEQVYSAVDICIKKNITPHVDFIFGLPGEKEEDIYLTMKVINDLISKGAIIHAHRFFPLPQTPFAKEKPGEINKNLRKFLGELSRKGKLYGNLNLL